MRSRPTAESLATFTTSSEGVRIGPEWGRSRRRVRYLYHTPPNCINEIDDVKYKRALVDEPLGLLVSETVSETRRDRSATLHWRLEPNRS
jgi:hypothetical protein